jgi:hypothetical protein
MAYVWEGIQVYFRGSREDQCVCFDFGGLIVAGESGRGKSKVEVVRRCFVLLRYANDV